LLDVSLNVKTGFPLAAAGAGVGAVAVAGAGAADGAGTTATVGAATGAGWNRSHPAATRMVDRKTANDAMLMFE
jgi:hypothetical protein